jgi:hypothetical protein
MLKQGLLAFLLVFPLSHLSAQILIEQGSLKGFLLGEAPGCNYDNYVSHIVEGIAQPGFNDYNPLDPQSDGFGECIALSEDDAELLATFKDLFIHCVRGNFVEAESLRVAELSDYPYRLVHLTDPFDAKEYYLFREELDSSYVDENELPDPEDDEIGSFNYGWGLYVFATVADNPRVLVEMPHPNDDYISPGIGFDFFNTIGAGALFINGAGREVVWTEQAGYNNSKSLSDPTRNGYHIFQMAHEAFIDYYLDEVLTEMPFAIQVHSYDTQGRNLPGAIIAPRYNDFTINLPLFDWSGIIGGVIDRTSIPVHPVGVIGNQEPVAIEAFYGSNSLPRLVVLDSILVEHEIPRPSELFGYSANRQVNYRSDDFTPCTDHEWIMHVEFDELPNCVEDTTETSFYTEPGFPLTWRNFEPVVSYYHPVAVNLETSLVTMATYNDTLPPVPPTVFHITELGPEEVLLGWNRARDPSFASYRLYYDSSADVDTLSSYYDSDDFSSFCAQTTETVTIVDLIPGETIYLRLAAVDRFDQLSALTPTLAVTPEDTEPAEISITGSDGNHRLWWQADSGIVNAVLTDNYAGVDGSALQYRRDWNQDDDYSDPGEEWATLPTQPDSTWIEASYSFGFAEAPVGDHFELRARDTNLADWVYTGSDGEEGIEDDWQIFIDLDPPATPLDLMAGEIGWDIWVDLTWTPVDEDPTFASYLLYYAFEEQPDSNSNFFDSSDFSELADPGTDSLRVDGLEQYGSYWLAMAARDWAGNISALSIPVNVTLPPESSPFIFSSIEIVADDNGNGVAEAGETVELNISLENTGTGNYSVVNGLLSTEVLFLELQEATAEFPGFAPGEVETSLSPFRLSVDAEAPVIFMENLNLQLTFDDIIKNIEVPFDGGMRELYYSYDVETDTAGWIHTGADGWEDQWHQSEEQSSSPVTSWKCGDDGNGDYSNHLDARLISPPLQLYPFSQLSIMHRIEAEVHSSNPDSAYDGGIVEISLDDGESWSELIPVGAGYNSWFRWFSGDNPATHPFVPGTPCFSGSFDWREDIFDLAACADSLVLLRFRFGSDDGVAREGWFLDDIALYGAVPLIPLSTLTIQFVVPDAVIISWEPHPQATGYRIYRSSIPWSGFELLTETGQSSFTTSIDGADAWFYRVTWLSD